MSAIAIVDRREWVLTDAGRRAPDDVPTCEDCDLLLVINGCYMCTSCGTVYGVVCGYNRLPRRNRWRQP